MSIDPTYSGEVQFASYTDSSKSGPRITLRLQDRADLEKFIGMEGKRFMLAMVQVGDDEQPVPPPAPAPKRERMGPLCEWAVMRCKEPSFIRWIELCHGPAPQGQAAAEYAAMCIKDTMNIDSRKELDGDPILAQVFKDEFMAPYAAWLKREGVTA